MVVRKLYNPLHHLQRVLSAKGRARRHKQPRDFLWETKRLLGYLKGIQESPVWMDPNCFISHQVDLYTNRCANATHCESYAIGAVRRSGLSRRLLCDLVLLPWDAWMEPYKKWGRHLRTQASPNSQPSLAAVLAVRIMSTLL